MRVADFEKQLGKLSEAAFEVGYASAESDEGCCSSQRLRALEKKRDDILREIEQHYSDLIMYGV